MFAVYIIHEQPTIRNIISGYIRANDLINTGGVLFVIVVVFVGCVIIDKSITPIWRFRDKIFSKFKFDKPLY